MNGRRNSEGYSDPTAYAAMKSIEQKEARVQKLRSIIAQICDLAGFKVQGKIILIDKRNGEIWR